MKPAGTKESKVWSEAAKYEFARLTQNEVLYAMVKGEKIIAEGEGIVADISNKILSLHLINTSLPDKDIIVADALLSAPHLGVVLDS